MALVLSIAICLLMQSISDLWWTLIPYSFNARAPQNSHLTRSVIQSGSSDLFLWSSNFLLLSNERLQPEQMQVLLIFVHFAEGFLGDFLLFLLDDDLVWQDGNIFCNCRLHRTFNYKQKQDHNGKRGDVCSSNDYAITVMCRCVWRGIWKVSLVSKLKKYDHKNIPLFYTLTRPCIHNYVSGKCPWTL